MENKSSQQGFYRFKVKDYKNNNEQVIQLPSDPNKAMRFDNKTDEEFVKSSNYKTNLPIEVLISNPEPKRKRRNKIPRRLNKWIIYRRDKSTKFKGLKASVVTEKVRIMWANEPEEVKEFFAALSRLAVKSHMKKYGEEYKYKPGPYRRGKKKERKERISSPSSEESPNIPEYSMDTTSSSSESSPELSFLPTPLLESMQTFPLQSDEFPELPFFPTPESTIYSPATSSISDFDSSLEYPMQAFPPLPIISFSEFDAGQLPLSEELLPAQHLTPAASNFTTPPCSAYEKLLSTFTEEQLQLLELAQDNIEFDSSVHFEENSDTTKTQDDWLSTNQDQTYTNNLMVYNDIQQHADSNLDFLTQYPDWLLFDIENSHVDDTSFDYNRQPSL